MDSREEGVNPKCFISRLGFRFLVVLEEVLLVGLNSGSLVSMGNTTYL